MVSINSRSQQLQVLQLVLQGHSNEQIAELTGLTESFISTAPNSILRRHEAVDVEHYRNLQNERLNRILSAWWDTGLDDVEAANFVLKLLQEQNKLNGLYKNTTQGTNFSPAEFQARLQQYVEFEVERRVQQQLKLTPKIVDAEVEEEEVDES